MISSAGHRGNRTTATHCTDADKMRTRCDDRARSRAHLALATGNGAAPTARRGVGAKNPQQTRRARPIRSGRPASTRPIEQLRGGAKQAYTASVYGGRSTRGGGGPGTLRMNAIDARRAGKRLLRLSGRSRPDRGGHRWTTAQRQQARLLADPENAEGRGRERARCLAEGSQP